MTAKKERKNEKNKIINLSEDLARARKESKNDGNKIINLSKDSVVCVAH
jgi:hypothetical protein